MKHTGGRSHAPMHRQPDGWEGAHDGFVLRAFPFRCAINQVEHHGILRDPGLETTTSIAEVPHLPCQEEDITKIPACGWKRQVFVGGRVPEAEVIQVQKHPAKLGHVTPFILPQIRLTGQSPFPGRVLYFR